MRGLAGDIRLIAAASVLVVLLIYRLPALVSPLWCVPLLAVCLWRFPGRTLLATLASLTMLAPASAWAQDDLLATPPPRRTLEGVEDRDDPEANRAARERARIAADPTEGFLDLPLRHLTPTAAVGMNFAMTGAPGTQPGVSFWLGAKYYPMPLRFSPFVSLGVEVESYQANLPRRVDLVPMARLGTSWMAGNPSTFLNRLLPQLDVYAIGGVRMRDMNLGVVDSAIGGFGVSSPMMGPGTAFMLLQGVPLPNILEVTVERPLDREQYDIMLQVGIGI